MFGASFAQANWSPEEMVGAQLERLGSTLSNSRESCLEQRESSNPAPPLNLNLRPIPLSACNEGLQADEFKDLFEDLQRVMVDGFYHDPGFSPTRSFSSHYDWHSSVHAHWAILASARLQNNTELREKIMDRLSFEEITRVRENLKQESNFENPYGRAWLVLLLDEMKIGNSNREQIKYLEKFQKELTQSVLEKMKDNVTDPNTRIYAGAHDSWLTASFLLTRAKNLPRDAAMSVQRFNEKFKNYIDEFTVQKSISDFDFVNPTALAAILADKPFSSTNHLSQAQATLNPNNPASGHNLGLVTSELWPLAKKIQTDRRVCEEYLTRLNEFMKEPNNWAVDFDRTTHWVPQFVFMSAWLALGQDKN